MSNTIVSQYTKIYEVGDLNPDAIIVDAHLNNLTIAVQPLNVPAGDVGLIVTDPKTLLTETNAVGKGNMAGSVTLSASTIGTFEQFPLNEEAIDLANPVFITTDGLMSKLFPTFDTIVGSTHIAVTVTGRT